MRKRNTWYTMEGLKMTGQLPLVNVGIDLVEVNRFAGVARRRGERFLQRVFTERELEDAGRGPARYEKLAARFAAKEAVLKALGIGLRNVSFKDVEILSSRDPSERGKPMVAMGPRLSSVAEKRGISCVAVSLTHVGTLASAVAAALGSGAAPSSPGRLLPDNARSGT